MEHNGGKSAYDRQRSTRIANPLVPHEFHFTSGPSPRAERVKRGTLIHALISLHLIPSALRLPLPYLPALISLRPIPG